MIPIPPLNLNQSATSSAKGGQMSMPLSWDASGFSVNYGSGVVQGGGGSTSAATIPKSYWLIAAVIGVVLWKKKFS